MSPDDPWIGTQLGPYSLRERLGSGGGGVVYVAWDQRLEREVALKVVMLAPGAPSDARARFRREAVLAARLNHPNIVPIYDVGEAEHPTPLVYLAMRRLPGRTLADLLDERGPLPEPEAIRLTTALAEALDYAHRQGVLHRDLKPGNVLLDEEGRPLLADFGIAKAIEAAHGGGPEALTLTGTTVGTPAYMSPEQAAGQPLDARSDLYSLGVLLYEMLTGRPPFTGSPPQVMRAHLEAMPVPPSRLRPGLAPALDHVVLKVLAKEPAPRFASGAALADALRRLDRGDRPTRRVAGLAEPSPAVPPPGVPWRWALLGASTVLLLLCVGTLGVLLGRQSLAFLPTLALSGSPTPTASETAGRPVRTPSATPSPSATATNVAPSATLPPSATVPAIVADSPTPSATSSPLPTAPRATAMPTTARQPTATSSTACAVPVDPAFEGLWQPTVGCPLAQSQTLAGAVEDFEAGLMFWRSDQDRVYVLFASDHTWATYDDPWNEGDPEFSCSEAEAAGSPKRGFGKVWCSREIVRERLGAAVNEERGATLRIQTTGSGVLLVGIEAQPFLLFPQTNVYIAG